MVNLLWESPEFMGKPEGESHNSEGSSLVGRGQVRGDVGQQRRNSKRDLKRERTET